jgi:mannose-6-phosphate isomerase-like protein (cupin superfamily)
MTEKPFDVLGRYAQRPGFRTAELRIGPAQEVPWHYHTNVRDTFYVFEGNIRISMKEPKRGSVIGSQPGIPGSTSAATQGYQCQ